MEASTKKTILISIASTAGLLLLTALGWFLYFNAQFSTYQDDQYKFSIKYPKTWKVLVHPRPTIAVMFMRPKDTALDPLQENFSVAIQPLPDGMVNLAQFSARLKEQMTGVFKKSINVVEDKSIHWGWREGHIWSIEAPKPDDLKMVNAWVLRSDQVCILTFLGNINKYAQDSLIINEMINSLQLQ